METFISADDLRVNLWNLAINDVSFNVVDLKPPSMDELNEVITCAEFHPSSCSQFAYSTSKGSVRLSDLRVSSLCDTPIRSFVEEEDPSTKSFFSEIISSISDIKFTQDGKYILARDYLTLKVSLFFKKITLFFFLLKKKVNNVFFSFLFLLDLGCCHGQEASESFPHP